MMVLRIIVVDGSTTWLMAAIVRSLPPACATVQLQFYCESLECAGRRSVDGALDSNPPGILWKTEHPKRRRRWRSAGALQSQRQPACSQPQPISITFDLSAFSQYSLQYLLSCSAGQSHAPCAHFLELVSAIAATSFAFRWGMAFRLRGV